MFLFLWVLTKCPNNALDTYCGVWYNFCILSVKQNNLVNVVWIHRNGFDPKRIEVILHKIELGQKHQSAKFGLNLGIVSLAFHIFLARVLAMTTALIKTLLLINHSFFCLGGWWTSNVILGRSSQIFPKVIFQREKWDCHLGEKTSKLLQTFHIAW